MLKSLLVLTTNLLVLVLAMPLKQLPVLVLPELVLLLLQLPVLVVLVLPVVIMIQVQTSAIRTGRSVRYSSTPLLCVVVER